MSKNLIVQETITQGNGSVCRADFGPEDKSGNTSKQRAQVVEQILPKGKFWSVKIWIAYYNSCFVAVNFLFSYLVCIISCQPQVKNKHPA